MQRLSLPTLLRTLLLALLALPALTTAAGAPLPSQVVQTGAGTVQGLIHDGVAAFKGIPYGSAPVRERRFLPPQPAAPWRDVLVAADFGAPAMQMYDRPHTGAALSMQLATVFTTRSDMKIDNEDSLYLNVWTPATDTAKRPVLVWLHGGGYAYGSGAWPVYDGTSLAGRGDVVVVTVNHRLNVFGYLYLAELLGDGYADSGNAGMLDLVLALEWVRDNIAAFGGDPGNVTIMGESGGGSKVSMLMAMPAAAGLFHKAIVQSGPGLTGVPAEAARASARAIVAELGVDAGDRKAVRERLIDVSADDLIAAVTAAQEKAGGGFGDLRLAPVVDGRGLPRHPFVPDAPAQSRDVPLLIGWNKDEMTIFNTSAPWFGTLTDGDLPGRVEAIAGAKAEALVAVYREMYPDYTPTYLYNAMLGDSRMFLGSVTLAERKAAQGGAPVYLYYLTWETPVGDGILKSPHTLDIPFMFANVDRAEALTGDGPEARQLESQMAGAWIAFARTGNPGHPGLPDWPAYDSDVRSAMVFDVPPRVVQDPNRAVRELLGAE
ncbi:MAG: carboxylesterase family protein [Pseudomonadales bacterium]